MPSMMFSEFAISETELFEAMPVPGQATGLMVAKSSMKRSFAMHVVPETMMSFGSIVPETFVTVEFAGLETNRCCDRTYSVVPLRRLDVNRWNRDHFAGSKRLSR